MADDNIIRREIIQLSFETVGDGLTKANKQLGDFKKSFSSGFDKGLDKFKKSVSDIDKTTKGLGKNNGIDGLAKSATRFTKTFQAVNRSIEDGGIAIAKFKNKLTSLPHNAVSKISHSFTELRLKAALAEGTIKTVAKTRFKNLKTDIKATKAALTEGQTGAKGFGNALKNIGKIGVGKAVSGFSSLKAKLKQSIPDAGKLKDKLKGVGDKLTDIGKKAAGAAFKGLKRLAGISFKAIAAGIGAAATAIGGLAYKSVQAYADFEQLKGGVETLLGANGAKTVQEYADSVGKSVKAVQSEYENLKDSENMTLKNANNAFKTAGMSANQYMETITTFAAAMKNSVGNDTKKAAELSDLAIQDMADNANKMGTPLENVSIVYSNLARGMYMTLDNLKLGFAGTKEGAKDMVNHAAKIDKSVKANDISYANLVKAIHAVQVEMKVTGTTSREAFGTIQGSLNMFKAAWGNLLPALIEGGDAFDQCVNNLIDSIVGFKDEATGKVKGGLINNLMPAIEKSLEGIGTLIERLAPIISKYFPSLAEKILPPLIKSSVKIVKGLIKALPPMIKTIATTIVDIFGEQFPIIGKIGKFFEKNAGKIANATTKIIIPAVIALIVALKGFKAIAFIKTLFGKNTGGGGFFSGITSIFKGLAQTDTATVLRGMLNLTIILGGLGALVWAATKVFKNGVDMTQMLKVAALIGVFGIVGGALGKFAGIVGNIPILSVVKGLANMAIMLGGIGAVVWAATKVFKNGVNFTQMLQVAGLIGVFGVIGGALSALAAIIGLIPIVLVLKGLANMAVVLGGLGTLLFVATKVFKNGVDFTQMFSVIKLIGILGLVGSGLSVLAGVIGLIPIPVVLAGLTNIGLVIGGMTALIVAYGKLSEIPKFNEFISKGGDTLANLFRQIGKIGGSLVGGLGEGISNSLPTIGKNLAAFAKSVSPMFTLFTGVDMSGVGSFFSAFGSFMLKMAKNKALSFFAGETNLADVGTQLSGFATKASGFFNKVAELPENGFTNATMLFKTLSGIGNLPKSGGIAQWFGGETDYEALANGLKTLSGKRVIGFFTKIAEMPANGFTNAKTLFKTLSGIGNIPKSGGFKQWFSGETDYSGLASGLKTLSGGSVVGFFNTYGAMPAEYFSNAKKLFKTLGEIGNLPKMSGWGGKGGNLTKLGEALKSFGDNAKGFFEKVNGINLTNLNGLWKSLGNVSKISSDALKNVNNDIRDIVDKVKTLPKKMGDGLKSAGTSLSTAMADVWKEAVKASVAPVNKLLDAANWVLKEFGSKKKVISWKPYAKGTNGHKGGNALVNDGRGAEAVQMPNGNTFIPQGKNVFIPNAPKGMKVLPAEQTANLMGRKTPTFHYADGIGKVDIWEYYDNAQGLVDKVSKNVKYDGLSGFRLNLGKGIVSTFKGAMTPWVKKLYDEEGGKSLASYVASKGVEQWRSTVIRALKMEGQYSEANVKRTLYQMQTESGGNPRAINLWDSNAKKGIPSKGLMQCIDPTFKAYARKGFDKNIYDPLSNILASIRYAVSRYGSLAKAYQGHGYANGGIARKPSIFGESGAEMAIPLTQDKRKRAIGLWQQTGDMLGVTTRTPESDISTYSQTNKVENNTYSPVFNLTINGDTNDRTTERKVKRWIKEAMDDVFTSIERKNRRLQEV